MRKITKHITFSELREFYLEEKRIVLKDSTYRGHCGKTRLFAEWLEEHGLEKKPLRKLTNQNIHDFFVYLAEDRDLDKSSCEKYRDLLKVFFKYAKKLHLIRKFPFKRIVLPLKKRDCKPKYIPKEKFVELFRDIRLNDPQLFIGSMIQYCSAVRPGNEMLNLKPADFNLTEGTIKVGELNAKTGKQRYADLTKELLGYLIEYGILEANPNHYLFGKSRKFGPTPISKNNLPHRFNIFRDAHGIDKGVKFYSCKHTGATDLINAKLISLPQLMRHLGHSRITSTEHYILEHGGVTNDIIKEQFSSPVAKVVKMERTIYGKITHKKAS
jgi:integrase